MKIRKAVALVGCTLAISAGTVYSAHANTTTTTSPVVVDSLAHKGTNALIISGHYTCPAGATGIYADFTPQITGATFEAVYTNLTCDSTGTGTFTVTANSYSNIRKAKATDIRMRVIVNDGSLDPLPTWYNSALLPIRQR